MGVLIEDMTIETPFLLDFFKRIKLLIVKYAFPIFHIYYFS